jgi:hypothetical protein
MECAIFLDDTIGNEPFDGIIPNIDHVHVRLAENQSDQSQNSLKGRFTLLK